MSKGVTLLIIGIVALIAVYSFRPPSGFGDALMMMGQGKNFYLKEPVYLVFMAISAIITILGITFIVKAKKKND